MKYILKKSIEGLDWKINVGDIIDSEIWQNLFPSWLKLLELNGTLEKVEEKTPTENKRWRAEHGELYYYIYENTKIGYKGDWGSADDDKNYEAGNYFQTKAQAQAVADKIKQILLDSHK